MKKISYVLCCFLLLASSLYGARRGDVKVIESSENIRYLSQKLVKDYLFLYQYPNRFHLKNELEDTLSSLNSSVKTIARITKNSDTKDILDFIAYSKDNMIEIVKEHPTKDNCLLMLDYSEMLVEGVNSIEKLHQYNFSKEEKMLMVSKKMEYLLERMEKYYLVTHLGFDKDSNEAFMNLAKEEFKRALQKINSYPYSKKDMLNKLNYAWKYHQIFLDKTKEIFVSDLVFLSFDFVKKLLFTISKYHSTNQ